MLYKDPALSYLQITCKRYKTNSPSPKYDLKTYVTHWPQEIMYCYSIKGQYKDELNSLSYSKLMRLEICDYRGSVCVINISTFFITYCYGCVVRKSADFWWFHYNINERINKFLRENLFSTQYNLPNGIYRRVRT